MTRIWICNFSFHIGEVMNTCEKFWAKPSEGEVNFGHTWVKTQSEVRMPEVPGLIKRRLRIQIEGVANYHTVIQYHYTAWPKQGVPRDPANIVAICGIVRSNLKMGDGACIVHCDDSVGRTGVVIALLQVMDVVDSRVPDIDIFTTVLKLRADRMLMVRGTAIWSVIT